MQISENAISILKLKNLYYKEVLFSRTETENTEGEMTCNKNITEKSDNDYDVELAFELKDKSYNIRISLVGEFNISCEDENMKKQLIEKNTISVLFPYIRSELTIITSQPGIEPIILPPLNINKLIELDESR